MITKNNLLVTIYFNLLITIYFKLLVIIYFNFWQLAELRPNQTKYKADRLVVGNDYEFSIKAVNAEGPSEALITDKPVEIRKKIGMFFK